MARPLCAEKRKAILLSAIHLFYNDGFNAPTSKIAREAKVSEGTIFTYFKNKQELMESVYLFLKDDLHDRICSPKVKNEDCVIENFKARFEAYVDYGIKFPERNILISRFILSKQIPRELIDQIKKSFDELVSFLDKIRSLGPLKDAPLDLALNIFANIGNNVIHFCIVNDVQDPELIARYTDMHFHSAWLALTSETVEATRARLEKIPGQDISCLTNK
ncbi:hypothetical protein CJP74_06880 [Psittacicella melopsittaci]|uniref:HTH tetR-type domain-containing protein n=1 Tax=Psittacicella melopsittaci TaxID=2028576 RepID=A0A3A1Y2I5_9GAMM|nr:TetR/AcrR family transcriptional regulator [Psittacicella melopsittaci]RIY31610.1 hypothetical protein CJP74_06880 [Psittacicella melopsittaci]